MLFPGVFGYVLNTQLPGIDNTLNYIMVEAVKNLKELKAKEIIY
jgi:hypothetical protein